MTLDFWALLFYSVKSFELVIICGFVKIEEDQLISYYAYAGKIGMSGKPFYEGNQLLCIRGEEIGSDRCRKIGSECCAFSGSKFVRLRIFFRDRQLMNCKKFKQGFSEIQTPRV